MSNDAKIPPDKKNNQPVFLIDDLNIQDPAILEFLKKSPKFNKMFTTKSELEFIRVLEDLIELLIKKRIIQITDFNEVVINKLLKRQAIRDNLSVIHDGLF